MSDRKFPGPVPDHSWLFVVEHADAIDKWARTFLRTDVVLDDFRQDLILDVVDAHARGIFDPDRGSPSTWIKTRARLNRTRCDRERRRQHRLAQEPIEDHIHLDATKPPTHPFGQAQCRQPGETMEGHIDIQALLDVADEAEWEAAQSVLLEWDDCTMRQMIGISRRTRNARLATLRAAVA